MRRACLGVALLVSAAAAGAAPLQLELSSVSEWPGGLTLRAALRQQDLRLAAACQSGPEGQRIAAGLSLPWLTVGPLAPAGLVREAFNPAGFGAGSDVFVQRSGLLLDLSLPSRSSGVLFMPLPRTFGVFAGPTGAGGSRIGSFTSLLDAGGSGIEAFMSVSEAEAANPQEEWLLEHPLFPGGRILSGAARILLSSPVVGMAASVGYSSGDRYPPGIFAHTHVALRAQGFSLYFLLAEADRTYVTPSGEPCLDLSQISCAAVFSSAVGTLDCRVSRSLHGLPFSPGQSREHRDEASIAMERRLLDLAVFSLTARLEGSWIMHEYSGGDTVNETRCAALVTARWTPLQLSVSVSRTSEETSAVIAAAASLDRRGSSLGLKGTGSMTGRGEYAAMSCSADAFFSLRGKNVTVMIEAGIEKVRAPEPRASFSWSARQ